MTRILLDPEQLAGAAADLNGAAGEYEAIGARVASCDCGCMPATIAATVDAVTAQIRRRLGYLASGLAEESGTLGFRAGVPQNGGSGGAAISAASGPGVASVAGTTTVTIGGDPYGLFSSSASSGGSTLTLGGDPYGLFSQSASSGGSTITLGGDPYGLFSSSAPSSGGSTLTFGGDPYGLFSQSASSGGYTLVIEGTPLYRPGQQEALEAMSERWFPLEQFFPRGIGVNVNPPFMPNLILMGDVLSAMSYNHMLDPGGGSPSYYNYYTHERVFFS